MLVSFAGLAIGAWLALAPRVPVPPPATPPARVAALPLPTPRMTPVPAPRRTRAAPLAPTPAPSVATPAPTSPPTAAATPAPTSAPTTAPAAQSGSAVAAEPGTWRIDEANVLVGPIIWTGAIEPAGTSLALDVHKSSVAGVPAARCERDTTLRATLAPGVAQQTVPYREVNCTGEASSGTMSVSGFSGATSSFSGTFARDGVKLGDFSARRVGGLAYRAP